MKKTIIEQMRVSELRKVLINNNALLVYIQNEEDKDKVDVCLRYMEHGCMKEQFLGTLPKDKADKGLMEINRDANAIALFQPDGEDFTLDKVYSIEDHTFGNPEFVDLMYKHYFPYNQLEETTPYQYKKKRGTMDGEHKN